MTLKFICISSCSESVPIGTILEGYAIDNGRRFTTTKDSDLKSVDDEPRFGKGYNMPMEGNLWEWKILGNDVVKPTRNILRGIKRKAKRNH